MKQEWKERLLKAVIEAIIAFVTAFTVASCTVASIGQAPIGIANHLNQQIIKSFNGIMAKKYIVDRIGEDCIRVYPEKQDEALKQKEVKKRKVTMYDYGEGNGFSITPPNLRREQKGTVFKIKDYPIATIHSSKNKFFIRLSFTKATCADAQRIMKRDMKEWFEFLQEQLRIEEQADIATLHT